jgi:hypothetical protein
MADDLTCAHCGGHIDSGTVCSETCRLIAEEGYWPSPVGPATHDEMVGWIRSERGMLRGQLVARLMDKRGDPDEVRAEVEALVDRIEALGGEG